MPDRIGVLRPNVLRAVCRLQSKIGNRKFLATIMRLGGPLFEKYDGPAAWVKAVQALGYRAAYCPVGLDADDAVLQEIRPTDMGGYDAFRRFRVARPEARVALTTGFGYDSAHSIVKARQDGLKYVLFKPFRQDQVVTAVLDAAPAPIPRPELAGNA